MKTKIEPLAITQAKIIRVNGETEYCLSKPKIKLWQIKKWFWLWKRIRILKKEREEK